MKRVKPIVAPLLVLTAIAVFTFGYGIATDTSIYNDAPKTSCFHSGQPGECSVAEVA
jgi:hypothetical protein